MNDKIYREAKRQVAKKKGFYSHLSSFLAVGMFLFFINWMTDPFDLWFLYPVLSWGIALFIHYCSVFGLPGTDILSEKWEERELENEMERLRKKGNYYEPPKLDAPIPNNEELELKELERKKWREDDLV